MFEGIVTVIHVIVALFLILVVLLQAGRGGGVSGAFGGGAGAAFGQASATNILTKMTALSAGIFMVTCMTLAVLSTPSADDPMRKLAEQQNADIDAKLAAPATEAAPLELAPPSEAAPASAP